MTFRIPARWWAFARSFWKDASNATLAWIFLVAITLAELLTTYTQPAIGSLAHAFILLTLLYVIVQRGDRISPLLLGLILGPLIRVLSLSLPLTNIPLVWWYFITSVPLFAAIVVAIRLSEFSWRDVGLGLPWRTLPVQVLVALSGLLLGYLEYVILTPRPLISDLNWQAFWLPALILLVSTGFLEELIFRGFLQRGAIQVFGMRLGLIYVSFLFAALHIGYRSFLDVIFVFLVGWYFAWIVARTRTIWGVTLAHGLTNIVLFLIMPFLSSGWPF